MSETQAKPDTIRMARKGEGPPTNADEYQDAYGNVTVSYLALVNDEGRTQAVLIDSDDAALTERAKQYIAAVNGHEPLTKALRDLLYRVGASREFSITPDAADKRAMRQANRALEKYGA